MSGVGINTLIKEAMLLNHALIDPKISLCGSGSEDKKRAEFQIKAFLEKASPYMGTQQLSPSLKELRETCRLNGLIGEFSLRVQKFVTPILKLPQDALNTIIEFLSPEDFSKAVVTSKASNRSLAKACYIQRLIKISKGYPVKDFGLTEDSLLLLIKRNQAFERKKEGITIKRLNLDHVKITNFSALLELCPKVHSLSFVVEVFFKSFVAEQVSLYQNIRELNLKNNRIGAEGARAISRMLNLTSLDLSSNYIDAEGAIAIAGMSGVTELNLSENPLGFGGIKAISGMGNVTSLDLSFNSVYSAGAIVISSMVNLKILCLLRAAIDNDGAVAISTMTNLMSLNLADNHLNDQGALAISRMLKLTLLNLSNNSIRSTGATAISTMANLKTLYLNKSRIDVHGASAISEMVSLTSLDLSFNNLGDAGAIVISRMCNVTNLFLKQTKIGDEGTMAVSRIGRLAILNLQDNNISDVLKEQVRQALKARRVKIEL